MPGTPRAPLRSVGVLVFLIVSSSSCAVVHRAVAGRSSTVPALTSVVHQRFATTVELDQGGLRVEPPGGVSPGVPASRAQAMFRGADAVVGDHGFAVFGLGIATVSSGASVTSDTTATSATGTSSSSTSSTPASSGPTSTGPSSTSPTSSGPTSTGQTTTTTTPSVPTYDHRLAWVGIVWGAVPPCPTTATSGPRAGTARPSRFVAVLLDAQSGQDALAYRSGEPACGGARGSPTVARPEELVSVAWHPVGPASTAVEATIPPCGRYDGWTQVSQPGVSAAAVEVVARVPFDPRCGAASSRAEIVDDVVPLGSGQAQLAHAALGPVDALRTLVGG